MLLINLFWISLGQLWIVTISWNPSLFMLRRDSRILSSVEERWFCHLLLKNNNKKVTLQSICVLKMSADFFFQTWRQSSLHFIIDFLLMLHSSLQDCFDALWNLLKRNQFTTDTWWRRCMIALRLHPAKNGLILTTRVLSFNHFLSHSF